MVSLRTATMLALVGGLVSVPSLAQDESGADALDSPAGLRCSALAEIAEDRRATAVAYIAGYGNALRDATTFATVGTSTEPANEGAAAAAAQPAEQEAATQPQAQQPAGDQPAGQQPAANQSEAQQAAPPGGQTLETGSDLPATQSAQGGGPSPAVIPEIAVDAIMTACAQSPDTRVVDIITAQGGAEN